MSRTNHKTVPVEIGGRPVEIDKAMAAIIERLWGLGIRTRNCCQGSVEFDPISVSSRDFAYIMFDDIEGLRAFLELFEGTELADRRTGQQWDYGDDGLTLVRRLPAKWMFDAGVHSPRHEGESFCISGTVRFAPSDVDLIRQCLSSMAVAG
jgi:hypothetical protein